MSETRSYESLCLQTFADLAGWGQLCARGFSHRPGAPDRFYRKYFADPTAHLEWTRVVVCAEDNRLVGSVRIFDRTWNIEGQEVQCAGLGEVCTDPDFRGKGISTMMLVDAVQFCEHKTGARFSALHAATAVAPLYKRFDYTLLTVPYARFRFGSDVVVGSFPLRAPLFADDWRELQAAYEATIARLGQVGATVRNREYWEQWMPFVTGGNMYVWEYTTCGGGRAVGGYGCIASKPEGFKLVDFGVAADVSDDTAVQFLGYLCASRLVDEATSDVIVPWLLLSALHAPEGCVDVADGSLDDHGWMVRPLHQMEDGDWGMSPPPKVPALTLGDTPCELLAAASEAGTFLVWPVDSY